MSELTGVGGSALRHGEVRRVDRYVVSTGLEAIVEGMGPAKMIDLSPLGARLEHDFPIELGARIRLKFRPNSHAIRMQLSGKIVWTMPLSAVGGPRESGIEFDQEAIALRTALDQLCRLGKAKRLS